MIDGDDDDANRSWSELANTSKKLDFGNPAAGRSPFKEIWRNAREVLSGFRLSLTTLKPQRHSTWYLVPYDTEPESNGVDNVEEVTSTKRTFQFGHLRQARAGNVELVVVLSAALGRSRTRGDRQKLETP